VASLYPELVTVIARADGHIKGLADLAGRRVNVGSKGTGTRATWDAIEAELGWRNEKRVKLEWQQRTCRPSVAAPLW